MLPYVYTPYSALIIMLLCFPVVGGLSTVEEAVDASLPPPPLVPFSAQAARIEGKVEGSDPKRKISHVGQTVTI